MEKRFYLAVRKNATAQSSRSAPVAVVSEGAETLKIRLLADCIARDFLGFIPIQNLEIIAREGEEFTIPNNYEGKSLREHISAMEDDDAFYVPMKDKKGNNGYVGELSYRQPSVGEQAIPQLELLEPRRKSKTKYTA